ncbi:DnaA/Hda family protein [uncultured Brevundimonas sp.]|uniref:DnaA ATPase domain-containing protein n=1 Tax=uncultured Brevundimonas sp. TaxID=213418 RepID=UPI0030EB97CD
MSAPPSRDQLKLPLQRDVPAGAAEFVRSGSNDEAVAALERWPDGDEAVLAICGPEGCGKSHLAGIWAERVGAVALHGAEAGLADPLELEGRPVLLDRAQDADDETLFHLINLAQSGGGALLLVSRPAPRTWEVALPDLRSRLDIVRTVPLQEPDDAVLAAILRARFAARSIVPGDEIIDYLVRRIDRSAAAVEAVVERLDAEHRPVTRALARQVLGAADETDDLFEQD